MPRIVLWYLAVSLPVTLAVGGCLPGFQKQFLRTGNTFPAETDLLSRSINPNFEKNSPFPPAEQTNARQPVSPSAVPSVDDDLQIGRREETAGNLAEAKFAYERVIAREASHPGANHRLAVIADRMGQFAVADRHYQVAMQNMPAENRDAMSNLLGDIGYSCLLRGEYQRSEQALTDSLRYNRQNLLAMRNLGLLYGRQGFYDRAFQAFVAAGNEAEARVQMAQLFPDWEEAGVASTGTETESGTEPGTGTGTGTELTAIPPPPRGLTPTFEVSHASRASGPQAVIPKTATLPATIGESNNRHPRFAGFPPQPTKRFPQFGSLRAPIPVRKRTATAIARTNTIPRAIPIETVAKPQPDPVTSQPVEKLIVATSGRNPRRRTDNEDPAATGGSQQPESPSRIALRWGSSIGPGNLFPTTNLDDPSPATLYAPIQPASASTGHNANVVIQSVVVTAAPITAAPRSQIGQPPGVEKMRPMKTPAAGNDTVRQFEEAFEASRRQSAQQREVRQMLKGHHD